ncbi:MAG: QueT transporter family protein [Clostridia bacterium]|nr:QueT transporter family protein [Clostridia bacterium]
MNRGARFLAQGAVIAALYVVLTLISQALGLLSFDVQFRFSEALCVLPMFTSAAVPGLALGCVLANLITGGAPWDIVFGSLATFIGAAVCRLITKPLRAKGRGRAASFLAPVPNILANTAILPFIIKWVYASELSVPLIALFVFLGELASCALGVPLAAALERHSGSVFSSNKGD